MLFRSSTDRQLSGSRFSSVSFKYTCGYRGKSGCMSMNSPSHTKIVWTVSAATGMNRFEILKESSHFHVPM